VKGEMIAILIDSVRDRVRRIFNLKRIMLKSFVNHLFPLLIICGFLSAAYADDYASKSGEDRILKFASEMMLQSKDVSFLIRDTGYTISGNNEVANELSVGRVARKYVSGAVQKQSDVLRIMLVEGRDYSEHALIRAEGTWRAMGTSFPPVSKKISEKIDEGILYSPMNCFPLEMVFGGDASYWGNFEDALAWPFKTGKVSVVAIKELEEDGKITVWAAYSTGKEAIRIDFEDSNCSWLPTETEIFAIRDGSEFDASTVKLEELQALSEKWKQITHLRFTWGKDPNGKFIPMQVEILPKGGSRSRRTLEFGEWKFGDEVDADLFRTELFDRQNFFESVAFQEWQDRIDQSLQEIASRTNRKK
jgi:hypothetical protein